MSFSFSEIRRRRPYWSMCGSTPDRKAAQTTARRVTRQTQLISPTDADTATNCPIGNT